MAPSRLTTIDFSTFANIINGQLVNSRDKYNGIDPTTKEKNWDAPIASHEDIENAVKAANTAFKSWSRISWTERTTRLERFKEVFMRYEDEMTEVLARETGKPKMFAAFEVKACLQFFDWHINMKEPSLPTYEDDEKTVLNKYIPVGPVAAICPWNFPIVITLVKILPAVLMGNPVIVKPSPFTPYSALKLVEIAQEAFPEGVVQALGGDNNLGPALVEHPNIAKITFTGSTATGKKIMASAAKTLKRVTLETGGNDPCIVLPNADLAKVVPQVAMAAFFNTGQVCIASKRVLIHESIYEPFIQAMADFSKNLKVGPSDEPGVMLGPIQNETQYERVKGFFADSKLKGYKFATGVDTVEASKGYYVQPAILDNPPSDSRIWVEEPFGPIVPCQPYSDIQDAIARANDSNTGLGATVFGSDVAKCQEVADQIESGTVWINSGPQPVPQAMFGGLKESGIGTELGTNGILAFANIKATITFKA